MILYTPLAMEEVFLQANEDNFERTFVENNGKYYCVGKSKFGYQLVGITSTDPNDYLNDLFKPGTYI